MIAREALTLKGARCVGADAIVTHVPRLTLIHIQATAAVWCWRVALGTRATEGAWEVLAPAGRAGTALGTLVHIAAGPAPLAAVARLTGNALEAPGFVLAFAIRAGARVSAFVDIFAHGRSGGFEPVARVAVALVVTRKVDAEAAVAAQVGLGAFVQVHARAPPGAHVQAVAAVAVAVVRASGVHADAPASAARFSLALVHVHAVVVLRVRPVARVAMAGVAGGTLDALSVATDVLVQSALICLCDLSRGDL